MLAQSQVLTDNIKMLIYYQQSIAPWIIGSKTTSPIQRVWTPAERIAVPVVLLDCGTRIGLARSECRLVTINPLSERLQIILIPKLVAQSCLLLSASLSAKQASICTRFSLRAYGSFYRSVVGLGRLTGANLLDVASIGVDEGIRSKNLTLLQDAYQRMHVELSHVKFGTQDGIHFDGG